MNRPIRNADKSHGEELAKRPVLSAFFTNSAGIERKEIKRDQSCSDNLSWHFFS
jgi:hypothetical protein